MDALFASVGAVQICTTGVNPFELMCGRMALLPIDLSLDNKHPEDILKEFEKPHDLSPLLVNLYST